MIFFIILTIAVICLLIMVIFSNDSVPVVKTPELSQVNIPSRRVLTEAENEAIINIKRAK